MQDKITYEMLSALKEEVASLEKSNSHEIQVFEQSLQDLRGLPEIEDPDWSSDLTCIEVITIEKFPSLSNSIREIRV